MATKYARRRNGKRKHRKPAYKQRVGRQKDIPLAVREIVKQRSSDTMGMNPACETMIPGVCSNRPCHWHHRHLRSRGGKHEPINGLFVCTACHEFIHKNPHLSIQNGWIITKYDFENTPVKRRGAWVYLDNYGGVDKLSNTEALENVRTLQPY